MYRHTEYASVCMHIKANGCLRTALSALTYIHRQIYIMILYIHMLMNRHPPAYACIYKLSGAFARPAQPVHTYTHTSTCKFHVIYSHPNAHACINKLSGAFARPAQQIHTYIHICMRIYTRNKDKNRNGVVRGKDNSQAHMELTR